MSNRAMMSFVLATTTLMAAGCASPPESALAPVIRGPVEAFSGTVADIDEYEVPTQWVTDDYETPGTTMAVPYVLVFVRTANGLLALACEQRPDIDLDSTVHGEFIRTDGIPFNDLLRHLAPRMPRSWGRMSGSAYEGRLGVNGLLMSVTSGTSIAASPARNRGSGQVASSHDPFRSTQ